MKPNTYGNPHKLTKEQDQEIAHLHLNGTKIATLARMFNVYPTTIRLALRYEGVEANSWKKHIKVDAFDNLNSQESAYWLGFIYADGYVGKGRCYTFSVKLKNSDREHLEKLRIFLEIEHPIFNVENKTNGIVNWQVCIRSSSMEFGKKLQILGISVGRPSPEKTINSIPDFNLRHFFRGMFDGDGCAHKIPRFTFLSQKEMLEKLREELIQVGVSPVNNVKKNGGIYRIDYGGFQQAMKIKNYLYQDASVFLERKLEIINGWTPQTATIYKRRFHNSTPKS